MGKYSGKGAKGKAAPAKGKPKGKAAPGPSRHPAEAASYHDDVASVLREGTPQEAAEMLTRLIYEGDPSKPGYSDVNLGPTLAVIADLNPKVREQYLDAVLRSMNLSPDQIASMPLATKVNALPDFMRPAFMAEAPTLTMGRSPGNTPDMEDSLLPDPPPEMDPSQQSPRPGQRFVDAADMVTLPARRFVETKPRVTPPALRRLPGEREVVLDEPGPDWTPAQVERGWRRVTSAPASRQARQIDTLEILRDRAGELTAEPTVTPAEIPAGATVEMTRRGPQVVDPLAPESGLRQVARSAIGLPPSKPDMDVTSLILGPERAAEAAPAADFNPVTAILGDDPEAVDAPAGRDDRVSLITDADQIPRRERLSTYVGEPAASRVRDRLRGDTNEDLVARAGGDAAARDRVRQTLLQRYLAPQMRGVRSAEGIIDRQNAMLLDPENSQLLQQVMSDLSLTGSPQEVVSRIPMLYRLERLPVPQLPRSVREAMPGSSTAGDTRVLDQATSHLLRHADPAYQAVMGIEPRRVGEGGYSGVNLDRLLGGIQRANFRIPGPDGVLYDPGRPSGRLVSGWLMSSLVDRGGLRAGLADAIAPAVEEAMQYGLVRPPSKGRMGIVSDMAGQTYQPRQGMALLRQLAQQAEQGRVLAGLPANMRPDGIGTARALEAADFMGGSWVPRTGDEWKPTAAVSVRVPGLQRAAEGGGGIDVSSLIGAQPGRAFSADDFAKPAAAAAPEPAAGGLIDPNAGTPFQPGDFDKVERPADFDLDQYEREYGYDPVSDEPDPNDLSYMTPTMNRALAQRALLAGLLA